jgi:hypothetical protein
MRLLALPFVLFCAVSGSAAELRATLDEAAQGYVRLVLEIGAHEKAMSMPISGRSNGESTLKPIRATSPN